MRNHEPTLNMTTPPDIHDVKPGTLITFVFGPGDSPLPEFANHKGKAYGILKSRWGDSLRVKMPDFTFLFVDRFTTVGIGSYIEPDPRLRRSALARL